MYNKDVNTKPLFSFILYMFLFLIICIVGITNVFAASYDYNNFQAVLYDNYGPTLHYVLTQTVEGGGYTGTIDTMTGYTSGSAWGFNSPIQLIAGRTYSISINPGLYNATSDIVLSTFNRVGIGTTLNNAISSYENNTNVEIILSKSTGKFIQYVFKANINANFIVVPFATSQTISNASFGLSSISLEDLGDSGVSQEDINNSLTNQTNELNQSITNSENNINNNIQNSQDNINSNIDDMEDSINSTIKDNFNSCRDSSNFLDFNVSGQNSKVTYNSDGTITINGTGGFNIKYASYTFKSGTTYYQKFELVSGTITGSSSPFITFNGSYMSPNQFYSFTPNEDVTYSSIWVGSGATFNNAVIKMWANTGRSGFEKTGEICSNKIDETNDKLDEAEETRKGIWETIKDLPNAFLNMLKSIFIPDDEFFSNWWNDFSTFFDNKLGFLTTPIEIFIDFISSYLNLSSDTEVIINIPDITVPNFDEYKIIEAQSFNWSELLNSKPAFKDLWTLYLDFIDVFLILNFIGLCEVTYARIFGGDTSNYEYYTVEDSYTYDNNTGEVKSARRNERTTTRKKVV